MTNTDEQKICEIYTDDTIRFYKSKRKESIFNEGIVNPTFRQILLSLNPGNKKILDIGCGYGADLEFLKDSGVKNLTGIDASASCVRLVKENVKLDNIDVYEQGIYNIELNNKFDIAYSNMVLDQVDDLDSAFKNVAKTLNKNGVYVFSVAHPLNTATNDYSAPLVDYFSRFTGRYKPKTLNKELFYYHRTFEYYSEALKRNGFAITGINEPRPTNEFFKINYRKSIIYNNLPAALIISAQLL